MNAEAAKPVAELDLAELQRLYDAGSRGEWRVRRGFGSRDLGITNWWREREDGDGDICSVRTESLHSERKRNGERGAFTTRPIKSAEDDAKLIVAAVNALPELIRRAGYDGSETGWLIEWPADDYGPIRYWAAGRPHPVIDAGKATRFARREDAVAVMGAYASAGAKVAEHMWVNPASADTHPKGGDAKQAPAPLSGAVPEGETPTSSRTPSPTQDTNHND